MIRYTGAMKKAMQRGSITRYLEVSLPDFDTNLACDYCSSVLGEF